MNKIAVVGNGPVDPGRAPAIDEYPFVVRFNACRNYGAESGVKTDVLVIVTTGSSGERFAQGEFDKTAAASAHEIWFTKSPVVIRIEKLTLLGHRRKRRDWIDWSDEIVERWFSKPASRYLPASNYYKSKRLLKAHGADGRFEPSSGFLAVNFLLSKYPDSRIDLFGFSFEGWNGHHWAAERNFMSKCPSVKIFDSTEFMRRVKRECPSLRGAKLHTE